MGAGRPGSVEAEDGAERRPLGPADEQLLGGRRGGQVEVAADVGAEPVGAADRPVQHVRGGGGEARGPRPVGGLVSGKVAALIRRRPRAPGVAGTGEEPEAAVRMEVLIALDLLPGRPVVEGQVAVVHRHAGLAVVEMHAEEDLLAEVLHEAVEAEVEDPPHLALPVAHGGRVGEVDQGDLLAGGSGGQVGAAVGVGRDPALLDRSGIGLDPGAQIGERVDAAAAERADHLRLEHRVGEGVDRQAVVAAREAPALDPVGADRDPVAAQVAHVGAKVCLVVGLGLAEVLDQPVHHRPQRPAGRDRLATAQRGQGVHRPARLAGCDDVAQPPRRGGDVPAVRAVGSQLEAAQLRLVEQEPVATRGDELGQRVVGRRRAVRVERRRRPRPCPNRSCR